MLQNIRDRLTGGIAIAFLVLLSVPFLFFGITNFNFVGSNNVATVNGEEIPLVAFENAYRQQLQQYGEFAGQLSEEMRGMIRESVLNSLVYDQVIEQYLADSNYRISDEMVTRFIQNAEEFQVDGRFSKQAYYDFLGTRGADPLKFEANQRVGMRRGQLERGVVTTAFVTPGDYRRYLNLVREEREVAVATFDIETVAETVEVSDEEIQAYYEERPDEFRSPETVDLKYIELARNELAQQVEITEAQIREYYEQESGRFLQDEQRRASHILIPFGDDEEAAREQATSIAERIRAGEPFADLARQYSADGGTAEQGGDLGARPVEQFEEPLGNRIFSMQEGEISDPVRSDFGFHVLRLDEIVAGGPLPLDQVRAELERELRTEKAENLWRQKEEVASDALFDAENIETVAAAADLPVKTATGYTRNGGAPFGRNQAAIDAVFDEAVLSGERITDLVELDANRAVAVEVTAHNEAAALPLAEVRDDIAEQIRSDKARAIVRERAVALENAVRDGQAFAEAAEAAGAGEVTTATIRRDNGEIDANVRAAVFRMQKPEDGAPRVGSAQTSTGDQAVFALTGYSPGRPEAMPVAQRDEGKRQLARQTGQSDYIALVMELERRADVVRNSDVLDQQSQFQ